MGVKIQRCCSFIITQVHWYHLYIKVLKKKKRSNSSQKSLIFLLFVFFKSTKKRKHNCPCLVQAPKIFTKALQSTLWSLKYTHTHKKYMRHTHTQKHGMSSVHGNEWNVHSRWWTKPELFVTWCLDPHVYGLILCASCWWNWTKHCPLHRCTLHTRQPQTDFTPCPFVVRFFAFSQRWQFFFVPG